MVKITEKDDEEWLQLIVYKGALIMRERNCNSCRSSMWGECEALKANEEYQSIIETGFFDMKKFKFRDKFICDKYKSMYIEYPIEVSKINQDTEVHSLGTSRIGKFVKIRPCKEEYQKKTYLGLYLGDLPVSNYISHNPETKELNISFHTNPAIFIFDLNKIIFGMESWWGVIQNEEDMKEITNNDIENVWYAKALKTLSS
jgi:hypothetical protein